MGRRLHVGGNRSRRDARRFSGSHRPGGSTGIHHVGVAVEDLDEAVRDVRAPLRRPARASRAASRIRASRRRRCGSARAASSCSRRSATTRLSGSSSPSAAPACTTSRTRWTTSRAAIATLAEQGAELIDVEPRARHVRARGRLRSSRIGSRRPLGGGVRWLKRARTGRDRIRRRAGDRRLRRRRERGRARARACTRTGRASSFSSRGRPVPRRRAARSPTSGGISRAGRVGFGRGLARGKAASRELGGNARTKPRVSRRARPRARRRAAQKGERAALEELYLIHFDRIYSYLHVSVGNRHDAEDLTTQTFLKMLESIGRFRWQSAPFSAWLFRIAHNLAMDHFRRPAPLAARGGGAGAAGLGGAVGRARGDADDRAPVDAGADREPLARAAAGADAEVRLQLPERRRRDDPRQDRGRDQVAAAPRARVAAKADRRQASSERGSGGRDRRAAELGQVDAVRGAHRRARERRGRDGARFPTRACEQLAERRAGAQGHACGDSRRRGARHRAGAARQPAPGRRAARRARRLLRHARAGRRPRDAEARAARRRPRPRRAAARAHREAGEVGRHEAEEGGGAARAAARASRRGRRRSPTGRASFRPSSSR